jgi:hypothetical protein
MQQTTSDRQRAPFNVQKTTCSMQQTMSDRQRAPFNVQKTTCSMQQTTCNHSTCNIQRAKDNVQHSTCSRQRATIQRATTQLLRRTMSGRGSSAPCCAVLCSAKAHTRPLCAARRSAHMARSRGLAPPTVPPTMPCGLTDGAAPLWRAAIGPLADVARSWRRCGSVPGGCGSVVAALLMTCLTSLTSAWIAAFYAFEYPILPPRLPLPPAACPSHSCALPSSRSLARSPEQWPL